MNDVCKAFLNNLTQYLLEENESRVSDDTKNLIDIAFLVAPVEQHIENEHLAEFRTFLGENQYRMHYSAPGPEDYYSAGTVTVYPDNGAFTYTLDFYYDQRMWGYCMCKPGDAGYNPKYRCCGNGCDWQAPGVHVVKHQPMGDARWGGNEAKYWAYMEAFDAKLGAKNADLARAKKERETARIKAEIERLQNQLDELEAPKPIEAPDQCVYTHIPEEDENA